MTSAARRSPFRADHSRRRSRTSADTGGLLRLLIHDYSGHPFQVQLSRELARRGHRVLHVHCPSFATGKGQLEVQADDPSTFNVRGVSLGQPFAKYAPITRLKQEMRYAAHAFRVVDDFRPDVILSSNCPLLAQSRLQPACQRRGYPFIFWQQDIYSLAMANRARARLGPIGRGVGSGFSALEARLARRATAVIAISDAFLPMLRKWGVHESSVEVIENWAPLTEVPPRPHDNEWARQHGLVGQDVITYAGTLGLKHDPRALLELARALDGRPTTTLVVVSEGPAADWLRTQAECESLRVLQLPFQPYDALPDVLGASSILLTLLERDAGAFSVPSKVLTYLCAGRPIVASIPTENLGARILTRSDTGIVVEPGDYPAFSRAVARLLDDEASRQRLGANARRYAETTFDIQAIADRFESILRTAASHRAPAAVAA